MHTLVFAAALVLYALMTGGALALAAVPTTRAAQGAIALAAVAFLFALGVIFAAGAR